MTALALTSVTDFLLSAEVLFLAGMTVRAPKARLSAAWFWAGVMLMFGLSALAGGIDHGFVEPAQLNRYFIQRLTFLLIGLMTFCLFMTAVRQFFAGRAGKALAWVAIVQMLAFTGAALAIGDFLVVVANYAPVLILFLGMNFIGLRRGDGSVDMIAGLGLLATGSVVQAAGVDALSPLDHNVLYHLFAMAGAVFLYRGGRRLSAKPPLR